MTTEVRMLEPSRLSHWFRRQRRQAAATESFPWYRAGYMQALDDIDRTGLRPITDETKRRAADRALKRWIDA
jgi:hypothetical protein